MPPKLLNNHLLDLQLPINIVNIYNSSNPDGFNKSLTTFTGLTTNHKIVHLSHSQTDHVKTQIFAYFLVSDNILCENFNFCVTWENIFPVLWSLGMCLLIIVSTHGNNCLTVDQVRRHSVSTRMSILRNVFRHFGDDLDVFCAYHMDMKIVVRMGVINV